MFGAYFFRNAEVHLYWMPLTIGAAVLGVPLEALTLVVAIHELAHAYTHLGRDIDGARWDTEAFSKTDVHIVEGLAQFYTEAICKKLMARQPTAHTAFESLLEAQSEAYNAYREWIPKSSPLAGELLRAAMIECRVRRIIDHSAFAAMVARYRGQLF